MATTSASTVATPVSTSSSAAAASTSASFAFQTVGEMFTCGQTSVRWTYTGSSSPLTLNITNVNVAQQAPLSTSSAASSTSQTGVAVTVSASAQIRKRQYNGYGGSYLPTVNEIVVAGIDPTAGNYTWSSVNVPQGWYQLYANVQNSVQATSSSFFVLNGTNTNCVEQFASAPSTAANSSSTSHSPAATHTSTLITPSHHSNAGAIAGGVIGGIAFLAVAFCAFFYLCLRRRTSRSQHCDEDGAPRRWSELAFKKSRPDTNTTSSTQKPPAALEADQTIIGSDEEVSTLEHEKAIAVAQSPPQLPPHQPILRSESLRNSAQTTGSLGRGSTNPESPGVRSSYNPPPGETVQLERANTGGGSVHHTRRKPAPRYDGAAGDGRSSSQSTLDFVAGNSNKGSPESDNILQHKSSLGALRPMHVMIPDPPPSAA